MASTSRTNPMYIDTSTTGLVGVNTEIMISGIAILATNATWVVTLKDSAGHVVYHADNVAGVPSFPCVPFKTTGLDAILTAAKICIYTIPS